MEAWSPVLTNIGLLIIACAQCIASVASICVCARRACACLRPRQPFDHNTFDARPLQPFTVHVDEKPQHDPDKLKSHELCKNLEGKLQGDAAKKKKVSIFLVVSTEMVTRFPRTFFDHPYRLDYLYSYFYFV